jgi:hypothetical protein
MIKFVLNQYGEVDLVKTPNIREYEACLVVKTDEYMEGLEGIRLGKYPTAADAQHAIERYAPTTFGVVSAYITRYINGEAEKSKAVKLEGTV